MLCSIWHSVSVQEINETGQLALPLFPYIYFIVNFKLVLSQKHDKYIAHSQSWPPLDKIAKVYFLLIVNGESLICLKKRNWQNPSALLVKRIYHMYKSILCLKMSSLWALFLWLYLTSAIYRYTYITMPRHCYTYSTKCNSFNLSGILICECLHFRDDANGIFYNACLAAYPFMGNFPQWEHKLKLSWKAMGVQSELLQLSWPTKTSTMRTRELEQWQPEGRIPNPQRRSSP